jgi:chromatin segregation and condensation protein Rec8/ScpA/Scc1 (kleisin family)
VSENNHNKPFYFKPPWNILFDLQMIEKVNPWDINLSFLLVSFLEEMDRKVKVDFRASGMALDSSATIYFMKAQLLLKLENPPLSPNLKTDFVPPPLILPLRYELTTTTIKKLLNALDEALKKEKRFTLKPPSREVLLPPPEIIPSISVFLIEMEERMNRILQKIFSLKEENSIVSFSRIIHNLDKLETIQTFIILLFLAHKKEVTIWQNEDLDEIFITTNGD